MRSATRLGATLALLGGVALAATVAAAQTSNPTSSNAANAPTPTVQGQVKASTDQANAFLKSLENFVTQSVSGPQPTVGTSVPPAVKLQPMPPKAAAALPQAKDHHVARVNDDTILIVDPATRQVVGIITADDDDDDDDKAGSSSSK